jgi:ppGpp synthetase/RelA/SpoT-type nucleotidyltranferase
LVALPLWDSRRTEVLGIIHNWRSCHAYPLHIVAKTLQSRTDKELKSHVGVVRRIKRLPSIALKLSQNPAMKLSQMQDIGGCRAVVDRVPEVERIAAFYIRDAARRKSEKDRAFLAKTYDYIEEPKADGYRGVHLIMKYQSQTKPVFNGQRVEIQIRSQLQHAWATAVETCQAFTGQALKSKIKQATETWLRFFALMSSAIAERERRPLVPGTPSHAAERKDALRALEADEQIIAQLSNWNRAIQLTEHPSVRKTAAAAYLMELDTDSRSLSIKPYQRAKMADAQADYLSRETATEGDESVQVVLVSAGSLVNLRRAYPNFYADTHVFIRAVEQAIRSQPRRRR